MNFRSVLSAGWDTRAGATPRSVCARKRDADSGWGEIGGIVKPNTTLSLWERVVSAVRTVRTGRCLRLTCVVISRAWLGIRVRLCRLNKYRKKTNQNLNIERLYT